MMRTYRGILCHVDKGEHAMLQCTSGVSCLVLYNSDRGVRDGYRLCNVLQDAITTITI